MRKFLLFTVMAFFTMTSFAYEYDYSVNSTRNDEYDYDDIDDMEISTLASKDTVWLDFGIHSPVDTYNPALKFQTRFILNEVLRLGLVGNFYNEANFINRISDETNDKIQNWDAIKNSLDVYIGWRVNDNIHLGYMIGGGVFIDQYDRTDDIHNNQFIEAKNGYGFIKTGLGVKLNSDLFANRVFNYILMDQFFEIQIDGNGSVGIEDFSFGSPLNRYYTVEDIPVPVLESLYFTGVINPTITYSEHSSLCSHFKYIGFQTYGKFGISIPFQKLFFRISNLNKLEFKIGLSNKFAFKFYSIYDYYNQSSLDQYNYTIKNHFDPSGVSLFVGIILSPIEEVEIAVYYKPNFIFSGTEWTNSSDNIECKDYLFSVIHELEASGKFRFPKVVTVLLGLKYYIKHEFEYQYVNDSGTIKETYGGIALTNNLAHHLEPKLELWFKIVDKKSVETTIKLSWRPKIILFDGYQYYTNETGSEILDTNILNLANWETGLVVKFDPAKL
ncbi:MAG: hypothetical protein KAT05_11950 [Spirochaetes bacterium]|nr:hypothetical protein [Spirochaetota bacterium]